MATVRQADATAGRRPWQQLVEFGSGLEAGRWHAGCDQSPKPPPRKCAHMKHDRSSRQDDSPTQPPPRRSRRAPRWDGIHDGSAPSGWAQEHAIQAGEIACLRAISAAFLKHADVSVVLGRVVQELFEHWPCVGLRSVLVRFDGAEYAGGCPCDESLVVFRSPLVVDGVEPGQVVLHWARPEHGVCSGSDAAQQVLLDRLAQGLGDSLARRLAEQHLERETELNRGLARVSRALIAPTGSLEEICRTVLEAACRLTGSPQGFVAYLDQQSGETVSVMHVGQQAGSLSVAEGQLLRFSPRADGTFPGLWGHTLNSKQPFYTNNPGSHPASTGVPEGHFAVNSFLAAPAIAGGVLYGQVCVANAQAGYRPVNVDTASRLADLFAVALHRKQLEEHLQHSERRFRRLAESARDMIWRTNGRGDVRYVNPAVKTLLGYEPSEAVGVPIDRYLHPDSLELVKSWVSGAIGSEGRTYALMEEVQYVHRDGSLVAAELVATPEFDEQHRLTGFQGISRDIRERRRAEEARSHSEQQLRALIANMPVMLQAFDEQGNIVVWNRECEQVTGFGATEIVGNPRALSLLYPNELQRKRVARTLAGQATDFRGWELEVTCRDGRTKTIEWSSIAKTHPVPGWKTWGIGVDVSDLRQAWEERRVMDTQLAHQQRLQALGTLASGVAHEINNPANIILNYAKLIADAAPEGSTMAEDAVQIIAESERIARIVRSLHSFTTSGTGRSTLVHVAELIDGVLSMVRVMLGQDSIAVTTDLPADLPMLLCQSEEIRQVILSLVQNARDALNARYPYPDSDKRLHIQARTVTSVGQQYVRLTVEDRGVGIPEEIRNRIFDPFFSTKPRAVGTGLGLYIAHRLVERHGGTIKVESEVARFTRVDVDLPANPEAPGEPRGLSGGSLRP